MARTPGQSERRIFFPWETRGGMRRFLVLGRVGPVLVLGCAVAFVSWASARERRAAGERQSRVGLQVLRPAMERYLFENKGSCPGRLEDLRPLLKRDSLPTDGWGRPFRMVCPTDRADVLYRLMSDGPDGLPGGLDRIEN